MLICRHIVEKPSNMKKIYLAICMLLPFLANATHENAAQVSAKYISNSVYEINIKIWVDSASITPNNLFYSKLSGGAVSMDTATLYSNNSIGNGIQEVLYRDTITLATLAVHKIVYSQCCRKASISNMNNPTMESTYAYTQIDNTTLLVNSTPEFMNAPNLFSGVNDTLLHNPLAVDIDGDSLVFSYQNPMTTGGALISMTPMPYPGGVIGWPFAINAVTGEISWIATMTGDYAYAIKVDEYRNGNLIGTSVRDALVKICVGCKTAMSSDFSFYNTNLWPVVGNNFQFQAYENVAFNYTFDGGVSTINSNTLSMNMIGDATYMANPATFIASQTMTNISGTYTWTPATNTARTRPYLNVLIGKETNMMNQSRQKEKTILVKVSATPTNIENANEANNLTVYPNPSQDNIYLQLNNSNKSYTSITVYSSIGQQLYSKELNQQSVEAIELNTSAWPAGNYIIKANGKNVITKQFTILR